MLHGSLRVVVEAGRCKTESTLALIHGEQSSVLQRRGQEHLQECQGRQSSRSGLLVWLIKLRAAIRTKPCEYDTCPQLSEGPRNLGGIHVAVLSCAQAGGPVGI